MLVDQWYTPRHLSKEKIILVMWTMRKQNESWIPIVIPTTFRLPTMSQSHLLIRHRRSVRMSSSSELKTRLHAKLIPVPSPSYPSSSVAPSRRRIYIYFLPHRPLFGLPKFPYFQPQRLDIDRVRRINLFDEASKVLG